ncbi:MAG: hypothetical protein ABMA13_04290 [Chthoniobacteraceae bacterium]
MLRPVFLAFVLTVPCLVFPAFAENLSPVAERPDWTALEKYQGTITRTDFVRLLDEVYAPRDAATGLIDVNEERASIVMRLGEDERFTLRFAKDAASAKAPPRFWREGQPLAGLRVALDPGHLGGEWARMEERWFRIGGGAPVAEGDLTLRVAELLAPQLTALGAEVLWVRRAAEPVTPKRPADFFDMSRAFLNAQGIANPRERYASMEESGRGATVQSQAELLFYRQAEIRHRAHVVNEELKPDLVLCLHFNADAWGDPRHPALVANNHFHVLVNGCYAAGELRLDDNRFEMLERLLGGITGEEHRVSTIVAQHMARALALPPYIYTRDIAKRVNASPYVWARNLLANRLYRCPVVFLEPYVMNSHETWERVQAGDYEGVRVVAGSARKSLVREYADAIAEAMAKR